MEFPRIYISSYGHVSAELMPSLQFVRNRTYSKLFPKLACRIDNERPSSNQYTPLRHFRYNWPAYL